MQKRYYPPQEKASDAPDASIAGRFRLHKMNPEAEEERRLFREDPSYDYFQFIENINYIGGDNKTPPNTMNPMSSGDNMEWLGFRQWKEMAIFSTLKDMWILPPMSGVYAITVICKGGIDEDGLKKGYLHTLYIGSSKCIPERLKHPGHWYQRIKDRMRRKYEIHLWVLPTPDYRRIERDLIAGIHPLLNILHNG